MSNPADQHSVVLVHVVSYQMTPVLLPSDRLVYLQNTRENILLFTYVFPQMSCG